MFKIKKLGFQICESCYNSSHMINFDDDDNNTDEDLTNFIRKKLLMILIMKLEIEKEKQRVESKKIEEKYYDVDDDTKYTDLILTM